MNTQLHITPQFVYFIQRIFFLKHIYFTQTLPAILVIYGFAFLVIYGIVPEIHVPIILLEYAPWLWLIYGFLLTRTCIRLTIVQLRTRDGNYSTAETKPFESQIMKSSASYELNDVDSLRLLQQEPGWAIYDALFNFYRNTKHGRHLSKQAYYTVIELQLNRAVPHIIFDSKEAKNRQFRYLYLQSQRLSLEGDFDTYFDTYAPQTYQVDTLSFISPEVMLALRDAHEFDIELTGSKVLLFGPLLNHNEIEDFKSLGLHIATALNDNLDNYRDDRLSGDARLNDVAEFGRKLLKNPMKYIPALVLFGAGTAGVVYSALTISTQLFFNQVSIVIIAGFVATVYSMIHLVLENRRIEAEYRSSLQSETSS